MLTKVIEQSKIDHFTKWFDRADKIVIVSHVGPDGDAIGSSLGLWHFFSSQGKTANVIVPNAFPDFLNLFYICLQLSVRIFICLFLS